MLKSILWSQQVYNYHHYNRVIYYLQKIPGLGMLFSDDLYRLKGKGSLTAVLNLLWTFFSQIFRKSLYFFFIFIHTEIIVLALADGPGIDLDVFSSFVFSLMILGLFTGSWYKIYVPNPNDPLDKLMVGQLGQEANLHMANRLIRYHGQFFIFYGGVLSVAFILFDQPAWQALALTLLLLGVRLLTQRLMFSLFRSRLHRPLPLWWTVMGVSSILGLGLLAYSLFNVDVSSVTPYLLGWPALFVGLFATVGAIGLLSTYPDYSSLLNQLMNDSQMKKASQTAAELKRSQVSLKEGGIRLKDQPASRYEDLEGVAYINVIFFDRLGHLLTATRRKYVLGLTIGLAIFLSMVFVLIFVFGDGTALPAQEVESFFSGPIFAVLIYFGLILSIGEKYVNFCFYNMDRYLMKHHFYRQPDVLLASIGFRFRKAMQLNLPILLVSILGLSVLYVMVGGRSFVPLLLTWLATLVVISFFNLHALYMYYLIQPYNEKMDVVSPIYKLSNFIIFMVPIILINNVGRVSVLFLVALLVFMALYSVAGWFAVRHLAPKTFKLK